MKRTRAKRSRASRKPQDLKKVLFARFMLIIAVFVLWIGAIGVRLVHLQVSQHEQLRERAVSQRLNIKKTRMLRGTIYDRNGSVLAMSVPVKTLYADPAEIEDIQYAARSIAKAVGLEASSIFMSLKEAKDARRRYVPIVKKLDEESFRKINKALFDVDVKKPDEPRFAGLHWTEDQKRSYPYSTLASQTIGFADAQDEGMAGIERSQNDILQGAVIKRIQKRDRLGRVYDETVLEREPPKDIVLTIDKTVQFYTEEALERGVRAANARSGMAIVIDPRTGEILALANAPSFDPALVGSSSPDVANHLIQSVYSPGSVFKLVTYSAALEKKLFTPTDEIDAGNGSIEVGGHRFTDSHRVGRVSYAQALAYSSNVCAIKTGLRVGKADFYSMVKKMGFGSRTGIELPAETAGIVRNPDRWNGDSLASMSIGYEIGVTPLQMATAFATIANDGIRSQPHIIKEIRDSDGSIVSATEPGQSEVVSAETARSLRSMLRQVVLTGTGRRAQLDGYSSAGKTGTAWKFDARTKRVESSKYVSSFIGFAPADDPRLLIAVVMDEPKSGARDGGGVSAPIFKEIAQRVLTDMRVPRDLGPAADQATTAQDIPEALENANDTAVTGLPDDDAPKTATKPAATSKERPSDKPARKPEKPASVTEKTAVVPAAMKLPKSPTAIWKTKPKT